MSQIRFILYTCLKVFLGLAVFPTFSVAQPGTSWNFEIKYSFTDAHVPVGAMAGDVQLYELDITPTSLNAKCQDAIAAGIPVVVIWNSESCNRAWDIATSVIGPLIDQHGSDVMWLEVALANEVHQTGTNELNFWATINVFGDTLYLDPQDSQVTPGGFNIPQTADWDEYSDFQQERSYRLVNSIQCYTQAQMDQIQLLLETADESMADIFGGPSGAAVLNPINKTIEAKINLPGVCDENGQCVADIQLFNSALNLVQQDLDNLIITSDRTTEMDKSMSVFPNPAIDVFEVRLNSTVKGARIRILNDLGQVVKSTEMNTDRLTISTDQLSKGIYSILLESDSGIVSSKRMSIQN